MEKRPAGSIRLGNDGRTARCGICGTTLGHIHEIDGSTALIEGYSLQRGEDPAYRPSKRLTDRHRKFRREAWRESEDGKRARAKLASGELGGLARAMDDRGRPFLVYQQDAEEERTGKVPDEIVLLTIRERRRDGNHLMRVYRGSTTPVICLQCGARLMPIA